jgi:hypothetical protein
MAKLIKVFGNPHLAAAADAASESGAQWMAWRLDDMTEVLRVELHLLVALPDGRVLERNPIPDDVPVSQLSRELIAAAREEAA